MYIYILCTSLYIHNKKAFKNIFGMLLGTDSWLNTLRSCLRKQIANNDYNNNNQSKCAKWVLFLFQCG